MNTLLVWVITCLIWSTVWLFIKLGLRDLPPFSFAAIRLLIALSILLPVIKIRRIPTPRTGRELRLIAVTGVLLLGLNYALVFWGAQFITSGLTAVIQAATPAFGLFFIGHYLPNERLNWLKLGAVAVGIGGVAIIFSDQLRIHGWPSLFGCLAVAGGAVCVAYSYVLVKAAAIHLNPIVLSAGQMICGVVPLMMGGLILEGNPFKFHWTSTAVLSLLYLALAGSIAAFALNYWLLQRMDAMKIMLMSIVEPPLAVMLGVLVLGETLSWRAILGTGCVLLGTGMILSQTNEQRSGSTT